MLNALPVIANLTDGFVALTDKDGRRIKVIDAYGNAIQSLEGRKLDLAAKAIREQLVMSSPSELSRNAKLWVIPLGECALIVTDEGKQQKEQQLEYSLKDSLNLIADVLGTEASLFDEVGQITHSVNLDGSVNETAIGQINKDAYTAMSIFKSRVVESSSVVPGARSILLPITRKFGLELSNILKKDLEPGKREGRSAKYSFVDIIGRSDTIEKANMLSRKAAKSISPVLLHGESGTGKELFAHAIHNASDRSKQKFIALNCGAIPTNLIESILFGYETGTFTGGSPGGKKGLFVEAHKGTLFLDEIGEMDLTLQTRLLRVLQEKEVMSLGSSKSQEVDVRIITATNKNLKQMVKNGDFREDLYYRINVFPIEIPALRQRMDDLEELINHFIKEFNLSLSKRLTSCSKAALKVLSDYHWPGNIRQLRNCIERIANLMDNGEIQPEDLPDYVLEEEEKFEDGYDMRSTMLLDGGSLDETMRLIERKLIEQVLIETQYNKQEAAKKLGISTTTLWRKISLVGLDTMKNFN
jgi:transcriptional regulator with PAS, ATPase and Fis domain